MQKYHLPASLLFFCILLSSFQTLAAGSVCIIRDNQNRVLVIEEILVGRLSLPGGIITENNPSQTAIRETKEETGVDVNALHNLAILNNSYINSCVSVSSIPIIESKDGRAFVPFWEAPHYFKEATSAFFVPLDQLTPSTYRYPFQLNRLKTWIKQTPYSPTHKFQTQHMEPHRVHDSSLPDLHFFQTRFKETAIGKIILEHGYLGGSPLFLLILPFVTLVKQGGNAFKTLLFSQILFYVLLIAINCHVAEFRPSQQLGEVDVLDVDGFSFPSLHAAIGIFCFYHYCRLFTPSYFKQYFFTTIIFGIISTSSLYLHINTVEDLLFASMYSLVYIKFSNFSFFQAFSLQNRYWGVLAGICASLATFYQQPYLFFLAVLSFSFIFHTRPFKVIMENSMLTPSKEKKLQVITLGSFYLFLFLFFLFFNQSIIGLVTLVALIGSHGLILNSIIRPNDKLS